MKEPQPRETAQKAFAEKEGSLITLRCRTPGEAYLVRDELERADIVAFLPEQAELWSAYQRSGYVELRVSAKAYESAANLRSVVEFQHQRSQAEQPLSYSGKALAMGCAVCVVPGLLVFAWLLSSYQASGCNRMAREFKTWFFLGLAAWVLVLCGLAALELS